MDDIRFKNLYDAMTSQIYFENYLANYGQSDIDLSKIKYNQLIATLISCFFSSVIDKYIEVQVDSNNQKNLYINISDEYLDILIGHIAVFNGNGYTIGDLSYKDSATVLSKLRNKLAHGDFIVDGNNLIFEEKGLKGIVDIDKLIEMVFDLEKKLPYVSKKEMCSYCLIDKRYAVGRFVTDELSFENYCRNIPIMRIYDQPLAGYERNDQYVDIVNEMIIKFSKLFKRGLLTEEFVKHIIHSYQDKLDLYGIGFNVELSNIYDSESYEDIKDYYFTLRSNNVNVDQLLLNFIYENLRRLNKHDLTLDYSKGLSFCIRCLKCFRDNPGANLFNVRKYSDDKEFEMTFFNIECAVLAIQISGFNSYFQYGLEKGLIFGEHDLEKVASNKAFDFSQLDLSDLDDPNMKIESKFLCYRTDVNKHENLEIKLHDSLINCVNSKLNYLDNAKNIDESHLNIFNEKIKDKVLEIYAKNESIENMREFDLSFDFNKYVRNVNIIKHIRNALSHCNVFIKRNYKSYNLLDTVIKIQDIYDGAMRYEKELSMAKFLSLYNSSNISQILFFYYSNIEDKSLVDSSIFSYIYNRDKFITKKLDK